LPSLRMDPMSTEQESKPNERGSAEMPNGHCAHIPG